MKTLFFSFLLMTAAAAAHAEDLTRDQMTPAEQQKYDTLKGDDASRYSVTRGYLRECEAAVKSGDAMSLEIQPFAYDSRFVNTAETAIVKKAIRMNMLAWLGQGNAVKV